MSARHKMFQLLGASDASFPVVLQERLNAADERHRIVIVDDWPFAVCNLFYGLDRE